MGKMSAQYRKNLAGALAAGEAGGVRALAGIGFRLAGPVRRFV